MQNSLPFFVDKVWLIPLLPLLGAALMLVVGRRLPKAAINWICCALPGTSFLIAVAMFFQMIEFDASVAGSRTFEKVLFTWIPSIPILSDSGTVFNFEIAWGYLVDPLSIVMALVVTGVGTLIHIYSIGYMEHEEGYYRYFGYLNLFMFMMLTLVLSNSALGLFVGWEGVGLCSYLLIGFFINRLSATDAGKKAFIVNRIGDAAFLLGMFLLITTFGSLQFTTINAAIHGAGGSLSTATLTLIAILLFIGATGKSAQIPLYVWLPDAMEGPTPVSALIHAATMVTAGVYMVARMNAVYQLAPVALALMATVGAVTALFAASMALVQTDIKKVLAYSTISQLGYMFLACGVGAFAAGVFHLTTHAFFKALLFLGSGAVIHGLSGEQDIRKMGGLRPILPITSLTFTVGAIAIAGIPPLAGFFSKDEILWRTFIANFGHESSLPLVLWGVATLTAVMTAFYMFRLVFLTFDGKSRLTQDARHHAHEAPSTMAVPLMILAGLSIVGGWMGIPAILGGAANFEHFLSPIFTAPPGVAAHAAEHSHALEYGLMFASVALAAFGIWFAYHIYLNKPSISEWLARTFAWPHKVLSDKYYVDEMYSAVFVDGPTGGKGLGSSLGRFDAGIVDGGVNGAGWLTRFTSTLSIWWDTWVVDGLVNLLAWLVWVMNWPARVMQTGMVQRYAWWMVSGVVLLMLYYVERYGLGS